MAAAAPAFTLVKAMPDDVLLCINERDNPERDFLDAYWGEVLDALCNAGIHEDVVALIGGLMNANQKAEMERLQARALELVAGVDWATLKGRGVSVRRTAEPGPAHSGWRHLLRSAGHGLHVSRLV